MGKRQRRERDLMEQDFQAREDFKHQPRPKKTKKNLEPKTEVQAHYLMSIETKQLTFGVGPAGTGKTYVCTKFACQQFELGNVEKIIVTRPAVEAGGGLGFLPGNIHEKFAPYFAPFRAVLDEHFGAAYVDNLIKLGKIEIQPLEYIRGLTFENAFVILDEAQNTTPMQMKLFLSRIGEYSTVVVNGDITQKDIEGQSGLQDAIDRLTGLDAVNVVEFDEDDIVRSGLVKEIIKRYRN